MDNKIISLLNKLGLSDDYSLVPFFPRVRDREDVSVLRCRKSGVLVLSRTDHMDMAHYETKRDFKYWGARDRKAAVMAGYEDTVRRFDQFKHVIANKKWLDVGTGAGGILDMLSPIAAETIAVEPQEAAREQLGELGYTGFASLDEVSRNDIEVATLFHVFEHLSDPIGMLSLLKSKMAPRSKLIVEVPHARDFLLTFLGLDAFKAFTFWSEHLLLHTRESLSRFLAEAGFDNISIKGCQRYPLANHLYWLARQKPGGHVVWNQLRTVTMDMAYGEMLASMDYTDTLIAVATVGD